MILETDIKTFLSQLNIPAFRGHAPVGTTVPYIVYKVDYNDNFFADNKTFVKMPKYSLSVYNTSPDLTLKNNIETLLTNNLIPYTCDEADNEDQDLFITYYYFGG